MFFPIIWFLTANAKIVKNCNISILEYILIFMKFDVFWYIWNGINVAIGIIGYRKWWFYCLSQPFLVVFIKSTVFGWLIKWREYVFGIFCYIVSGMVGSDRAHSWLAAGKQVSIRPVVDTCCRGSGWWVGVRRVGSGQ